MEMLMHRLDYEIPTWTLKKRIEVSLADKDRFLKLRGVD